MFKQTRKKISELIYKPMLVPCGMCKLSYDINFVEMSLWVNRKDESETELSMVCSTCKKLLLASGSYEVRKDQQ